MVTADQFFLSFFTFRLRKCRPLDANAPKGMPPKSVSLRSVFHPSLRATTIGFRAFQHRRNDGDRFYVVMFYVDLTKIWIIANWVGRVSGWISYVPIPPSNIHHKIPSALVSEPISVGNFISSAHIQLNYIRNNDNPTTGGKGEGGKDVNPIRKTCPSRIT